MSKKKSGLRIVEEEYGDRDIQEAFTEAFAPYFEEPEYLKHPDNQKKAVNQ